MRSRVLAVITRGTSLAATSACSSHSQCGLRQSHARCASRVYAVWYRMTATCQGCRATPLRHPMHLRVSQLQSVRTAWRSSVHSLRLPQLPPFRRPHAVRAAGNGDPSRHSQQRSDSAEALTKLDPVVALGGSWAVYGSLIIAAQAFRLPGGRTHEVVTLAPACRATISRARHKQSIATCFRGSVGLGAAAGALVAVGSAAVPGAAHGGPGVCGDTG